MVDAQINVFGPNAVKQSMLIFSRVFFKVCQLQEGCETILLCTSGLKWFPRETMVRF
jgi:hypothetical protein